MREDPWREQARGLVFLPAFAPQVALHIPQSCNFEVSMALLNIGFLGPHVDVTLLT